MNKYQKSLQYHSQKPYGKLSVVPTKPLITQEDLALAYSPGVAGPCLEIAKDPDNIYQYTSKGNMVAILSNGTAVLGLGNIGAAASKPVMEGKAALFYAFADINAIDVEIDETDPEKFVEIARKIGNSWGGINLEDIKAPECFIIEQKLQEALDIPVFHDDQHGTAIISLAAIMNACEITGRDMKNIKIVINGAGAAGIACAEILKSSGVQEIILCDSKGVVNTDRQDLNIWKQKHAVNTKDQTLSDAIKGADVFIGLSVKDALSTDMLKSMSDKPIVFALANPDPEILPDLGLKYAPNGIFATGRSDYPNQVNNVLGFPFLFRGALDVRATQINQEMKIAAAYAIAEIAKQDVPEEICIAYGKSNIEYGPNYIIPKPFDKRLKSLVSSAVSEAARKTGVSRI